MAFISDIQAEGGSRGGAVIIDFSATAAGVKKVKVVTADDPDGADKRDNKDVEDLDNDYGLFPGCCVLFYNHPSLCSDSFRSFIFPLKFSSNPIFDNKQPLTTT